VLGLILVSQAALKLFDSAGGSIINTSSVASTLGFPNASIYGGTKGAVDAITARSRRNSARADSRQRHSTRHVERRERTRLALRGATCKRRSKHDTSWPHGAAAGHRRRGGFSGIG